MCERGALGRLVELARGDAAGGGAALADERVVQRAQQIGEIALAAQHTRAREHARVGLLHEVVGVVARAAQCPGRPVQAVEVVAESRRVQRVGPVLLLLAGVVHPRRAYAAVGHQSSDRAEHAIAGYL